MGCSLANHYTSQLKMHCTNWQSVKNTRVLGLCFVVLQKANALKSVEGHFYPRSWLCCGFKISWFIGLFLIFFFSFSFQSLCLVLVNWPWGIWKQTVLVRKLAMWNLTMHTECCKTNWIANNVAITLILGNTRFKKKKGLHITHT